MNKSKNLNLYDYSNLVELTIAGKLINLFSLYNIKYEYIYHNNRNDDKFKTLFPNNPYKDCTITDKHVWSFKIFLKDREILLDIDGPIHEKLPNEIIIDGFDKSGCIQFIDNRRLYQTDGLDAYVLKSDNLNIYDKNVKIHKLNSNNILTFSDFMEVLNIKDFYK